MSRFDRIAAPQSERLRRRAKLLSVPLKLLTTPIGLGSSNEDGVRYVQADLFCGCGVRSNDTFRLCSVPYDPDCLDNPYGAGSPYKPNGLMNPYSDYGSPYSNKSWTNPYATNAPRIIGEDGTYHGRLSTNPYDPDSTSNPMADTAVNIRPTV